LPPSSLSHLFSILLYVIFLLGYGAMSAFTGPFYYAPYEMLSRGIYWFLLLLVPTISVLIDYIAIYFNIAFKPNPVEIAIERDR